MYVLLILFALWFAFDYSATFIFHKSSTLADNFIETQAQLQVYCYVIVFYDNFLLLILKAAAGMCMQLYANRIFTT